MTSIAGYAASLTSMLYERGGAGGFARLFLVAALIVALAVMILVARAYDLSRKREAQSISLEARISRFLRADPLLSPFPILPTVRIPLWRGAPISVTMTGAVPRSELRHAALELALREARRRARNHRVEDGIVVDPTMAKRAA
jgi:hypothetical protein